MLAQYLKFFLKSTNQHGVHSPFVYDLVTKCFYNKTDTNLWNIFLKTRRQLLNNKKVIKVTDFGSGSRVFKTNIREISKITKVAGISTKKAKILIRIVNYYKPSSILEMGTSVGLATTAIKIANNSSTIITLEGCVETANVARNLFDKNGFKNINIITGNFNKTLIKVIEKKHFDCIYFDGNHTKKATLEYFNSCLQTAHNESFWIFDDICLSKEMQEAWQEIKKNPKVTVTVDLFHFGIVFFRKEQAEEHFRIRV